MYLNCCFLSRLALATALTERVAGTSAFLFGWADSPQRRGLAQRRKEIGWFKKVKDMSSIQPDVGPQATRRYGITGYFSHLHSQNIEAKMKQQGRVCFTIKQIGFRKYLFFTFFY